MAEFEQKARSIWNGLENIYSVSIDVLPKLHPHHRVRSTIKRSTASRPLSPRTEQESSDAKRNESAAHVDEDELPRFH